MLVQDMLTGDLHEVPDHPYRLARGPFAQAPDLSEYDAGETVYDGFGNPVGVLPLLVAAAKAPAIASFATKALPVVSRFFSMVGRRRRRRVPAVPMAPVQQAPMAPVQQPPPAIAPGQQPPTVMVGPPAEGEGPMLVEDGRTGYLHEVPAPQFYRPPPPYWMPRTQQPPPGYQQQGPAGWVRPAQPFTGVQPRRVYLRCSTWRAPAGLVPQFANQPGAYPGAPAMPGMPMPGMPWTPGQPGGARRRPRRGRRR